MPDQNNQDSWVQSVGRPGQAPSSEQPWSTQQGGQTGQEPWSTQQSGQNTGQGGLLGGPVHVVRQDVEGQMNGLIDHLAGQVPGGHMFAPEAKQAMSGILNNLQQQLESQAEGRLGGMGSTLFGNPNNPGNSGSQL